MHKQKRQISTERRV